MKNYQMRLLQYEGEKNHFQDVRMVEINGDPWFVGADVAKVLDYKNTRDAIQRHCDAGGVVKHDIPTESGVQNMVLINEPNIFRLAASSKLPGAKKFEKWIYEEVLPQIRKQGFYGKIDRSIFPNFIQRMFDNQYKIPYSHFAVLMEMFTTLYREFERCGYSIPDKGIDGKQMMPDISVGQTFSRYLKENYPEWAEHQSTYKHKFPNGKIVKALMYPIDVIPIFRKFIFNVWLPKYADSYFSKKDPLAIKYIPKVLGFDGSISEETIAEDAKKIRPRLKAVKQTVKKTK